jgi:hypothetical protein
MAHWFCVWIAKGPHVCPTFEWVGAGEAVLVVQGYSTTYLKFSSVSAATTWKCNPSCLLDRQGFNIKQHWFDYGLRILFSLMKTLLLIVAITNTKTNWKFKERNIYAAFGNTNIYVFHWKWTYSSCWEGIRIQVRVNIPMMAAFSSNSRRIYTQHWLCICFNSSNKTRYKLHSLFV